MINDMFRTLLVLLFLERVLLQAAPPSLICPEAYVMGNSSCYKLVRSSSHYYFANNECKKSRGTLAEIKDFAEDQYIWNKFYNTTRQLFWIGLSDALQEGIFQWEQDGRVLEGYNNWATGQPSTISGGVNNALANCVVYNGSGWLLSYCVTSLHNYLCEADVCESVDGISCRSVEQPSSQSEDSSSSTPIIIVIVVIVILVTITVAIVVLYVMYKKCNGVFMKYIGCCGCTTNQDEVLSLQQENQRLRHELSQHKLQLSASPSNNDLIRGWSKPELLSGIPDGKGGYLPAIRQSPMNTASPTAINNGLPPLNKSISGARVAPAPFVPQSRTQTPSSPFIARPTSQSSLSRPLTMTQLATTPQLTAAVTDTDKDNKQ